VVVGVDIVGIGGDGFVEIFDGGFVLGFFGVIGCQGVEHEGVVGLLGEEFLDLLACGHWGMIVRSGVGVVVYDLLKPDEDIGCKQGARLKTRLRIRMRVGAPAVYFWG